MVRDGVAIGVIAGRPSRDRPVHGRADRAPQDLRRPGGDRDRERPPVQGAGGAQPRPHRDAGAADGDGRDPAGHLELADRRPAGVRLDRAEREAALRGASSASSIDSTGHCSTSSPIMGSAPKASRPCGAPIRCAPGRGQCGGPVGPQRRRRARPGRPRGSRSTDTARWRGRRLPQRSLAVPMVREASPSARSRSAAIETGPFPERQIDLLKTFADQAVIAIENVRLFKELEARNRDLTETLEQQTATGEILRVISSSPTDVQPVFETIVRSVVRLCDGVFDAVVSLRRRAHSLRWPITTRSPRPALDVFGASIRCLPVRAVSWPAPFWTGRSSRSVTSSWMRTFPTHHESSRGRRLSERSWASRCCETGSRSEPSASDVTGPTARPSLLGAARSHSSRPSPTRR